MNDKSKPSVFSRRGFIKGIGSGVVGTYMVVPGLSRISQKVIDEVENESTNKEPLTLKINGKKVSVLVEPRTTLAELLRNRLKLTGTKVICNQGDCGGCTVLMDGKAVFSCHLLALDAAGTEITTIEGLLSKGKLHPVQEAFAEHDGLQCGFCTPGQIMAAQAILIKNPKPSKEEILDGMSGNLCRCAAYPNILKSVVAAAGKNK
jgi:aerobic-type carbon monoxide dehydrogenase small subunit (CoxS/CutS family)